MQHFINEAIVYLACLVLALSSAFVQEKEMRRTMGLAFTALLLFAVAFNFVMISVHLVKALILVHRRRVNKKKKILPKQIDQQSFTENALLKTE